MEAHQASPAASRAEVQPDLLSVSEEEVETISSVTKADIPTPPNDQAQHCPAQCENEASGTNAGQCCGDITEAPRIRDGGPVRKGRQVAWGDGGDGWQGEDEDEDGMRRDGNNRRPRHSTNTSKSLRAHSTRDILTTTIC